ncbi:MAG: hypothetical protein ACYTFW_15080 [Planctomycetota bacterium]
MKRLIAVLIPVLMMAAVVYADDCGIPTPDYSTVVTNVKKLYSEQNQQQIMHGQDCNHGGWETVKACFPNGPNNDNQVYEQTFDPDSQGDMKQLRGVIESLSYDGPLEVLGGILNGVGAVFGGPDNFHHGRGFEIANSLSRSRRPKGKPLFVLVDSNVNSNLLRDAGYAYVGKVSLEGKVNHNWDQVYDAAVVETLPWDVDILVVSGGMKSVTIGSNSSGITEGKGEVVLSAEGFRFWPEEVDRRKVPKAFYESLHAKKTTKTEQKTEEPAVQEAAPQRVTPVLTIIKEPDIRGIEVSQELYDMAGFDENQLVEYTIIK